jgi:hypothetical protein
MNIAEFKKWLAESSLYKPARLPTSSAHKLAEHVYTHGISTDVYCPECADRTTYICLPRAPREGEKAKFPTAALTSALTTSGDVHKAAEILGKSLGGLSFQCARNGSHKLQIYLRVTAAVDTATLTKIGQFPSMFDQASEKIRQYRSIASEEDTKELNSAVLCDAHGFHVAAYTYLRRVFERRLEVAHEIAKKDPGWNETEYSPTAFMEERIDRLRAHLPSFLVEHRKLYNVLSRGIHELTEQECANGYEVVYLGVTLILDEEIERKNRANKIAAASKSIKQLHEKHSS